MSMYNKYKDFTMIKEYDYINNIELCKLFKHIDGCVVECGVWRGGMIAGIAETFGNDKSYRLFDSFEGLPKANLQKDGAGAVGWQEDITSPTYYDNCSAEIKYAQEAMKMSNTLDVKITKGWFKDTLPRFNEKISILRIDGDWYESILTCFENLWDKVSVGGLIILDDYYVWDGTTRATHDFLSRNDLHSRVRNFHDSDLCYIIKLEEYKL